ncbi:MAG: hypothetical protein WBL02_09280 [Methanomethylovorans sp.]|uniref:hypothetical protein n=1 Tax=Methanomethylovorans sp. TaxID=2758717 RepID=UPI000AD317E9|nr:hypothetical protein [Methanomethylovorans sp.]
MILIFRGILQSPNFGTLYVANGIQEIPYVYFDKHLYQPLLVKDESNEPRYKIFPDNLNTGEKEFLENLKKYVQLNKSKFTAQQQMFILRNLPKKGIGFFVDTLNYYQEFIIWIKNPTKQHIILQILRV